ncbi:MAG TPA: 30S ribosome-binding factor RbfA [Gammaproteobacteria bacterium]
MPREFTRSTRVAEQLRRELGELLRHRVKDPRAQGATLTDVEVSKDVSYARIYFSQLDDAPEQIKETQAALNRAAGYLRHELSQIMRMRHVPELKFIYDRSVAEGMRMDALIDAARERDRQQETNGDGSED